jgi:hypothetical protein
MAVRDTTKAREAAARKRAGASPEAARTGTRKRNPALAALALAVAAVAGVWLMFASATPGLDSRLSGLRPWRGGAGWRIRAGQYIDPAAEAALIGVGQAMTACTPQPMTLDVSREKGGLYPPHKSHQKGRDIDIRMTDLSRDCRVLLQKTLTEWGFRYWYDGPDAIAPAADGVHKSHLHARFL